MNLKLSTDKFIYFHSNITVGLVFEGRSGASVHTYTTMNSKEFMKGQDIFEFRKPISIDDDCWISSQAVILPGVYVGHRCIIGAGAIISEDLKDDAIFTGSPRG